MKRMLKLILVLVSIAVLGCSSSKDVINIPGPPVDDGLIQVDILSDADKSDISYHELFIRKESDLGGLGLRVSLNDGSLMLEKEFIWRLYGTIRLNDGTRIDVTNVPINLNFHPSINKRRIKYIIYSDGTVGSVF